MPSLLRVSFRLLPTSGTKDHSLSKNSSSRMLRQSFVSRPEGRKTPRADPANVDFLLLSSEEFADVSQGGGTALFSVAPGHDHEVEFLLPAPPDDPVHCDLVFRNSRGGVAGKNVPADFSLTFGEQ